MREVRLQLAQPLTLLLRAFAFRHIDLCSDNLDQLPTCGEQGLADQFEVFDRSIRQYNSEFARKASFSGLRVLNLRAGAPGSGRPGGSVATPLRGLECPAADQTQKFDKSPLTNREL